MNDRMTQPFGVYVRADEAGRITAINSDAFLASLAGWTKIDEGFGDRYHHAQGNYLPEPLTDDRGVYRWKLVDGQAVPRTMEEMEADYQPPTHAEPIEERVERVEGKTNELDAAMTALMEGIAYG